ncbi:MAG: ATP-binding cassette domain-containing protein [SAR324 cluster bacterium]|nr:ATP-binding cassette domain-containing protein [SAR324 cluster bacterium]
MATNNPLLRVEGLVKKFPVKGGIFLQTKEYVHAVSDVSLDIQSQQTLGLVGESGSGKSTLGRLVMRLIEPNSGSILFDGKELTGLNHKELLETRTKMQMVFQDPADSLNSRMSVEDIILEPLVINSSLSKGDMQQRLDQLLDLVGLSNKIKHQYPHEFSGGQRQRIGIARALALSPKLIIADEPVSALDVSIQAQILNLMKDLQDELDLSYLFIAHDIHVIFFISHEIAVMYLGEIVEKASKEQISSNPRHPYTQALLSAVPKADPTQKTNFNAILGEIPSPIHLPTGCNFHPRCPMADEECKRSAPLFLERGEGHFVACHKAK